MKTPFYQKFALFLALLMIFNCMQIMGSFSGKSALAASSDYEIGTVYIDSRFDDYTGTMAEVVIPKGWTTIYNSELNQNMVISTIIEGQSEPVLNLVTNKSMKPLKLVKKFNPDLSTGLYVIEATIMTGDIEHERGIELISRYEGVNSFLKLLQFDVDGKIKIRGRETCVIGSYEADQWYDVKLLLDIGNKTVSAYIDGELKAQDVALLENWVVLTEFNLYQIGQDGKTGNTYVDYVKLYSLKSADEDESQEPNEPIIPEEEVIVEVNTVEGLQEAVAMLLCDDHKYC